MLVYIGHYPRAPLTKLARYANTLINIAKKNKRTIKLSRYRHTRTPLKHNRSLAYSILTCSDARKVYLSRAVLTALTSTNDKLHQSRSSSIKRKKFLLLRLIGKHKLAHAVPLHMESSRFINKERMKV